VQPCSCTKGPEQDVDRNPERSRVNNPERACVNNPERARVKIVAQASIFFRKR
jgi:hypothetical protein